MMKMLKENDRNSLGDRRSFLMYVCWWRCWITGGRGVRNSRLILSMNTWRRAVIYSICVRASIRREKRETCEDSGRERVHDPAKPKRQWIILVRYTRSRSSLTISNIYRKHAMKLASRRNSRLRKYFKLSIYEIALRMSAFQECLTCELNPCVQTYWNYFRNILRKSFVTPPPFLGEIFFLFDICILVFYTR